VVALLVQKHYLALNNFAPDFVPGVLNGEKCLRIFYFLHFTPPRGLAKTAASP
jgi:hypothetical protein